MKKFLQLFGGDGERITRPAGGIGKNSTSPLKISVLFKLKQLLGIRSGYIKIEKIAWKIAEHERRVREAHILANYSSLRFSHAHRIRDASMSMSGERGTDPKASPEGRKGRSGGSAMRRSAETGLRGM